MATRSTKPKVPAGLKPTGRALWNSVTKLYALRADEVTVLEDACRTSDMIAALEAGFEAKPTLMVRGSQGQQVINPIIAELRQYRAARAALLRQLKLPEEGASSTPEARSAQARAAVNVRWQNRGAGGN